MDTCRGQKRHIVRFLGLLAFLLTFCVPAFAGTAEGKGEYEIYPTPQSVEYAAGTTSLTDQVDVTYGDSIDGYTKKRVEDALGVLGLKQSAAQAASNTKLIVGVYGSGDAADAYSAQIGVDAEFFNGANHYDAYAVWISNGTVVILGEDVDASYYGVTTLKRIFEQLEGKSVRNLTLKDYGQIEFRGFIEGYYGNPWSNEDRIDLMQYGSEIKMNQYIYAPKDDPLHNRRWRDLYDETDPKSEESIQKIADLAKAGNESKCFFVYALHPFMNNAVDLSDNAYDAELKAVQDKFEQVIRKAGVRQIAILEDDATGETAERMVRFLNDMQAWLEELKMEIPDLKTDILYCPTCYMATTDAKMTTISEGVSEKIHILVTGGRIWGKVTKQFSDDFFNGLNGNGKGRYPYMWVNWPCNDNTKNSQIMGGHNYILNTGVEPGSYEGIVLNPIQESEPSKVGIFTAADYCWKLWESAEEGDQAWDDAFKYIDHMTPIESDSSNALREVAKHQIAQSADQGSAGKQGPFEESVELKPLLDEFSSKLSGGTATAADADRLKAEFQKICDAAEFYMQSGTNRRMASQMTPFLSCLRDMTQADVYLMDAVKAGITDDKSSIWAYYSNAQAMYDRSKTYGFAYYNAGTLMAQAGRKYIQPFTDAVMKRIADLVLPIVNPEYGEGGEAQKYEGTLGFVDGWSFYQDNTGDKLTDGKDNTYAWFNTGKREGAEDASIVGDYIELDLGSAKPVGAVRALVGAGDGDKWVKYHLSYSADGSEWTDLDSHTGDASGTDTYMVNLKGVNARYVRLVNDERVNKWVKFSEFSVYSYVDAGGRDERIYTNAQIDSLSVDFKTDVFQMNPAQNLTLQPNEYIGLKLDRIHDVKEISVTGDGTGSLALEKSVNRRDWTEDAKGAARYIRLMNQTDVAVEFSIASFIVRTNEYKAMDLLDSSIGGATNQEDARALGTTKYWMDGDLSTKAKYCSTPAAGSYVTYDLGQEIELKSLRVYVLDTAIDYPRDAKIQASMDRETWTDILEIGDGEENSAEDKDTKPIESEGGNWVHDSVDVAYAYVENANIENVKARYIRLYFTAPFGHRWVELNEILINGGEFIPAVNDPTFETTAVQKRGFEAQNLIDGDLTTSFQPDGTKEGSLIYKLSDEKPIGRINILQSGSNISNAVVSVDTGDGNWKQIGKLDRSFSAFYTKDLEHIDAIKLEWSNVVPVISEIFTLKEPGDVLEQNETDARNDLSKAGAALTAANGELANANKEVSDAERAFSALADPVEKLEMEVTLQKLYAKRSAAEASVAENEALQAECEARVAEAEAKSLRVSAEEPGADRDALLSQAEEKESVIPGKQSLAADKRSLAESKKIEADAYEAEANKKQEQLPLAIAQAKVDAAKKDLAAAEKNVTAAKNALSAIQSQLQQEEAKWKAAAGGSEKLRLEVAVQKLYAQRSAAEAALAEKEAAKSLCESKVAKAEADQLRTKAESAGDEKDALLQQASAKDQEAEKKQNESQVKQADVQKKKTEAADYEKAAADKQKELDGYKPITEFKVKTLKYKVLDEAKGTVAVAGPVNKKTIKTVTVSNTVKYDKRTWTVVQINANAFKGCKKLEKLIIKGNKVKKICKQAFAQCFKLKTVDLKKATGIKIEKNAFQKINASARITVPKKKFKDFQRMLKTGGVPKKVKLIKK